jgi:hypothetical protein
MNNDNNTGLRPINESGPDRIRDSDVNEVYSVYTNLRAQDPNREKRVMLLESYCRYPYTLKHDECLVEGYGANYGELNYKVSTKIQTAVDFLTERPTAFTAKTNYRIPNLDPETAEAHSTRHSELITLAFQKFCINNWEKWKYNIQMDAFSWNMYGKAFEYWSDPFCPYSDPIDTKNVFPDAEASMYMDDWDSCFIRMELYAWQLWRMAQADQDNNWDRGALIHVLKYSFKQDQWEEEAIMRGFNNYNLNYQLANRKLAVVVHLVREYTPDSDGKQISKYIFAETWPEAPGSTTKKTKGFLYRKPFAFEKISDTLCMLSDQVGTGYYYNNPSFAEMIYVSCYEYERLMNRIMRGIDLSMMLLMASSDANAGDKIRQNSLQDAIIMAPGTTAQQVAVRIPTGEAFQVMNKVQSDLARGTASYEIGTPNPAGGSTPVTASQNRNDANRALQVESMYLKWMNQSYGRYGQQIYKRFVTDKSGETAKNLKKFEKWLADRDVPKECWDAEEVDIVSTGMQGAGNPQQRFDQAIAVMDVLSRVPATRGEQKAQRDALAALVGADKVDEYMMANKEFATKEEQLIMMENAALSTKTEIPVLPDQLHTLHFQLHIESASKDLQSAAAFLQQPANDIDKGIDLNEVANALVMAQFKAAHAQVHLQFIFRDQRQTQFIQQANQMIAELSRNADQIEKAANEMAQAREEKLAELSGTDPEVQKQQALAEIEINKQSQLAEIATGKALTQAEVQTDLAKKRTNTENEIKIAKASSEIAIKETKEAQDLQAKTRQAQLKIQEKEITNDLKRKNAAAPKREGKGG